MSKLSQLVVFTSLFASSIAVAQPGATPPIDESVDMSSPLPASNTRAPGETDVVEREPEVAPNVYVRKPVRDPLATTHVWGFGVRATGLSGIGALPGVNYGGELAAQVRHQEIFAELAVGRWKPEHTYVVAESPDHVELGLNVWTVRVGWSSMKTPLRGWVLSEAGELASARQMAGVVPRMMTGSTPMDRRWKAVGGGFGVAWGMTDTARLVGSIELAIPVNRDDVNLDGYGTYEPDPISARSCVGLEVGWR
ncbi:MAG TPA: hypothetical protein VMZ53_16435 [Kofleriaceae bacterium]|nr:hypothetical protein [Kofleriaceae bacterium]